MNLWKLADSQAVDSDSLTQAAPTRCVWFVCQSSSSVANPQSCWNCLEASFMLFIPCAQHTKGIRIWQ